MFYVFSEFFFLCCDYAAKDWTDSNSNELLFGGLGGGGALVEEG